MSSQETIHVPPNLSGAERIGRIPVRNLWLLLLFASDLFRTNGVGQVELEENLDDLLDLVGMILARSVEQRIRRNLTTGYESRERDLTRLRGRIDFLRTATRGLMDQGKIACQFEELTIDTPRNRYVCGALELVARLAVSQDLSDRCRSLAHHLRTSGVGAEVPSSFQVDSIRFSLSDSGDRQMIAAARLVFEMHLPTESAGSNAMDLPDRTGTWVRHLFERAVGGFYKAVLDPSQFSVRTGRKLDWPSSDESEGIGDILPGMETDIEIRRNADDAMVVIDTKFNAALTSSRFREAVLRSSYIYQMYAYLRTQEEKGSRYRDASGILLHPTVDGEVDESLVVQGHRIRFATVDLSADTRSIRDRLLGVAMTEFGLNSGRPTDNTMPTSGKAIPEFPNIPAVKRQEKFAQA